MRAPARGRPRRSRPGRSPCAFSSSSVQEPELGEHREVVGRPGEEVVPRVAREPSRWTPASARQKSSRPAAPRPRMPQHCSHLSARTSASLERRSEPPRRVHRDRRAARCRARAGAADPSAGGGANSSAVSRDRSLMSMRTGISSRVMSQRFRAAPIARSADVSPSPGSIESMLAFSMTSRTVVTPASVSGVMRSRSRVASFRRDTGISRTIFLVSAFRIASPARAAAVRASRTAVDAARSLASDEDNRCAASAVSTVCEPVS